MQEEEVPCRQCKVGLHRICTNPVPIPTILSFMRREKYATSETVRCCDGKESWPRQISPKEPGDSFVSMMEKRERQ